MIKIPQYFKRIPEWDAEKPQDSFKVFDDLSPLPVTRLEHWRDFQGFIKTLYDNEIDRGLIFRGQRRYDWKLNSSLGRVDNSNFFFNLEGEQLNHFRQAIRGRIQDHSLLTKNETDGKDKDNELWSIGQHQGLMTPLLDWTYSPYVALFFAFLEEDTIEESLMPNYYRSVYILNSSYFKGLIKDSKVRIFEPTKDEYGRLVSQDGLFTISPIDIDIENEIYNSIYKYLEEDSEPINPFNIAQQACKIYIKNKDRQGYLQHLDYMNINHKSLFPDLHGAAHFCNYRITDIKYNSLKIPKRGGSLIFLLEGKGEEYEKIPLYNEIEKIITKTLNDSLSDDEIDEIEKIDAGTKKEFKERPLEGLVWVPQIKILAIEITKQIKRLEELYIPSHLYKDSMKAEIDLILTKFDLKDIEPIQVKKYQVIDKIMNIKEIQDMVRNNKT